MLYFKKMELPLMKLNIYDMNYLAFCLKIKNNY